MFSRETSHKRKNDQDFSPVKHRCSSELDVSIHSQDENENSLNPSYYEDVEVFIKHSWTVPPWKPSDDKQMKQFEETSFLSPKELSKEDMPFYNKIQETETAIDNKCPLSLTNDFKEKIESTERKEHTEFKTYDNVLLKPSSSRKYLSPMNSVAQTLKTLNKSSNKYQQNLFLDSNQNKITSIPITEKSINLDTAKVGVKSHEIYEHIPYNKCSNFSLQSLNLRSEKKSISEEKNFWSPLKNNFDSLSNIDTRLGDINGNSEPSSWSLSSKSSVSSPSDSDNWRNTNNINPYYRKRIWNNTEKNVEPSNSVSYIMNTVSYPSDSENWRQTNNKETYFERVWKNAKNYVEPSTSMNSMKNNIMNVKPEPDTWNLSTKNKEALDVNTCRKADFSNASRKSLLWENSNLKQTDVEYSSVEPGFTRSTGKSLPTTFWEKDLKYLENSGWSQKTDDYFSLVEPRPANSSDIVNSNSAPSDIYNWKHAGKNSSLEVPYLSNLDKNVILSADITNWRQADGVKSFNSDLNSSSESGNWRQADPVVIQTLRRIIGKRERGSGKEYLVRWYGTRVDTWEKEYTMTMLHMTTLQRFLNKEKQIFEETTKLINTKFNPGFIDTHCHLDFVYNKLKSTEKGENYRQVCENEYTFPLSFEGCITCFCDPSTFREMPWYQSFLLNDEVYAAFGCHPHHSNRFGETEEAYLKLALMNSKAVALGEIGLDYSGRNDHSRELQQQVFKRQLKLAIHLKKPLVIHCRDAHDDCIQILKETVPSDTRMHRHCFTDTWEKAVEWLSLFKNCFIGITNIISQESKRGYTVKHVAAEMPLSRLLLETDAPYFQPHCLSDDPSGQTRYVSNPGMALYVASEIAKIRGIEVQEVLCHARKNTKILYGI